MKFTATGDTLTEHDEPIVLESLEFPETVITQVVEPKATSDRDKLRAALDRLAFEDPSFHVREDEETGQLASWPGWVSCTWRSSPSTAWRTSSGSNRGWGSAGRAWPTARPW